VNATEVAGWRERRITAVTVGITAYERGSIAPDARTIVLLHGLGHWTQAAWDELAPLLDPAVHVVAFDLPGFGRSEKPDVRYDTAFFAGITESIIDQLAPGKVFVCGHSIGGYIAANYAASHPERVAGLILIAPAGFLRSARFVYALVGSQLARWLFTRKPGRSFVNRTLNQSVLDPASIKPQIRAAAIDFAKHYSIRRAFAGVYTGAIQDFRDEAGVHARLRRWTGPTLLVWGRHDRFIPVRALAGAQAVYPQAEALICEHSGHLPMVEEAPLVAAAITRFLA
jgi:abhydrolase domain-containing protein 6